VAFFTDDETFPLRSSNLAWGSYDAQSRTLTLGFHQESRVYEYYDVPPRIPDALQRAGSSGKYFREHLYYGYNRNARGQWRRVSKGITYDEVT